jgi:hypothetical protein
MLRNFRTGKEPATDRAGDHSRNSQVEASANARLDAHNVHLKLMAGCISAEHLDEALLFGLVNTGPPAIIRDVPDMFNLGVVDRTNIRVFHSVPPLT